MIVQNMPGAGSVIAANFVYSVAKPDGLTIAFPSNAIYLDQLIGRAEVKYDVRKFAWIGSPVTEPMIFYVRSDSPFKTIQDIKNAKEPAKCGCHRHREQRLYSRPAFGRNSAADQDQHCPRLSRRRRDRSGGGKRRSHLPRHDRVAIFRPRAVSLLAEKRTSFACSFSPAANVTNGCRTCRRCMRYSTRKRSRKTAAGWPR